MTRLDRYIARNLLRAWLATLALLAVIFGLFAFIDELDNITTAYTVLGAIRFVLLATPQRILELFPVAALLGTIFAFATMARRNEIIAIRSTGISEPRQLVSVGIPAVMLMLLLWPLSEFVTAPMRQFAEAQRQQARSGSGLPFPRGGLWATDGSSFQHVGRLSESQEPGDINLFEFDPGGRLRQAVHAERGIIVNQREWRLQKTWRKYYRESAGGDGDLLQSEYVPELQRKVHWSRTELQSQIQSPASMTLAEIHSRLSQLRTLGQDPDKLDYLLWRRLALPLLTALMVFLGYQLSAGMTNPRNRSLGLQMGIGIVVSLAFYLASEIAHAGGQLLGANPVLVAGIPPLLAVTATLLLHRYRFWEN